MSHQLLPTAMSMDDVLSEEESARLTADENAVSEDMRTAPRPVVNRPIANELEPTSSNRWVLVVVLLLVVGGGVAAYLLTMQDDSVADDAVASTSSKQPDTAKTTPASATPDDADSTLPTDLESLRALSYRERHRRLMTATGDVPVEVHVALDLVQADQAENPCRTFADALSTIEASDNREPFAWAVAEAEVPSGHEPVCASLQARLQALRSPKAEPVAKPAAAPTPSRSRSKSRPRPKPSRPKADPQPKSPPPSAEPAPAEPKPTAPAKPRQSSVATKLDDGELRGLGE